MEKSYDLAVAYHEAGHAVAALALGRGVQRVSVLPDRNRLGWCEFRKGAFRPADDWLEREMLIALAGMTAEARHTGDYCWGGAEQDLRYVRRLAAGRAGERQVERLQKRLLAKTEHLFDRTANWNAVELIVAQLLECGEISGREAKHLFERAVAAD